jgi:hypothetical protein
LRWSWTLSLCSYEPDEESDTIQQVPDGC